MLISNQSFNIRLFMRTLTWLPSTLNVSSSSPRTYNSLVVFVVSDCEDENMNTRCFLSCHTSSCLG
ncbi:uncharacterized protein MELLADRAFT_90837 [Melampsora larici-populina 98AG31]|uniref:Uncharacterized protein n=1 Tax=Melampsora larici-populina (strain 98AG31 / pathotype 3-4-7) TaxID=747676 RepID=F4R7P9_MELLP|nr:uncharacterized protein MELLADRAFT_90837 [Melampsora larici-populina 98AG31]EGG11351.1 hypothetical protein MELLADRAFT_90837 [Melampsora larici-populina 98AG31]